MRKFLIALCMMICVAASAQSVMSTETLKTTDLGNQKLMVAVSGEDTLYSVALKTGNSFQKYIMVALGDRERALKLLQFLYDYKAKKGDIIDLENATHNTATYQGASGYRVVSEGGQLSGHLRKPNIKGFIKVIKEYTHTE